MNAVIATAFLRQNFSTKNNPVEARETSIDSADDPLADLNMLLAQKAWAMCTHVSHSYNFVCAIDVVTTGAYGHEIQKLSADRLLLKNGFASHHGP